MLNEISVESSSYTGDDPSSIRVLVDRGCLLELSINDEAPINPPQCKLLCSLSSEQSEIIQTRINDWLVKPNVDNWKAIFQKPTLERVECKICMDVWIDGWPATECCSQCQELFHKDCIITWMEADPSCRRVFERFNGHCPSCDQIIVIPVC